MTREQSPETKPSMHSAPTNARLKSFDLHSTLAAAAVRGALTLAMLFVLLLIAARPAHAQTETVLYNFTGGSDGSGPISGLVSHGGNFYGTTPVGGAGYLGSGYGTVFELSPNGSGGWTETVLYDFCSVGGENCTDGAYPQGPLAFDGAGNIYGTAHEGGVNCPPFSTGCGVVFELSPAGTRWTETVLYSFINQNHGSFPAGGLIFDAAGNLYGTTTGDGVGGGTVFELSPSAGGWTEQVLYDLGVNPGIAMDSAGNIFGLGASDQTGQKQIFELSPNGKGGWNSSVLYTFTNGPSENPIWSPVVLDQAGNIYGTWTGWYNVYRGPQTFSGTVYKITLGKTGWTEQVLFFFEPNDSESEGNGPAGGLIFDANGNIYGTTIQGGTNNLGTVFELVPGTNENYTEKVLWNFTGTDGSDPYAGVILDSSDNLYGTTTSGGSDSAGVVFELSTKTATSTSLVSNPNPSSYGQAVTFTATVTSSAGSPPNGETVTFYNGTAILGTGTLSAGSASFITSSLPVGAYSITANYPGDANFAGSTSAALRQVVNSSAKSPTSTALTSSLNPSIYGQKVTWTATVTTSGSVPPTGTVNLTSNGTFIGAATLNSSGVAMITKSLLDAGTYSLVATYEGNASDAPSSSPILNQVINQATSTTTLTSSPNPSTQGEAVTFTATVNSPTVGPTGSVTFTAGNSVLGTVQLSGHKASLTTSTLAAGPTIVTATYNGDSSIAGSSASITQTVDGNQATAAGEITTLSRQSPIGRARSGGGCPSSTTLSTSISPSVVGQEVDFSGYVFALGFCQGQLQPGCYQSITFYDGSTLIGSATLNPNTCIATLADNSLTARTHTITAKYPGNGEGDLPSVSNAVKQVVTGDTTMTTLSTSLTPSVYGQSVTWTATVTSPYGYVTLPTGRVNFAWSGFSMGSSTINASGVATLTRSLENADAYPLTAVYEGDPNNASSTSPILNQVITQTTSAATLSSSPNPSTQGEAVTFTATITSPTVTPTGPVTFTAGKTVLGTVQLSGGKARFTMSTLGAGSTTVTATYNGDSNIAESSASVMQTVQE